MLTKPIIAPGATTATTTTTDTAAPTVRIAFSSLTLPTGVIGLPGAASKSTAARYEATVSVSGAVTGFFKGSIYPDNMNIKGRLVDGTYAVSLGFHKPGSAKQSDLKVATNGFRPVLVINGGRAVPVQSNLATKVTADGVHIHNGYNHWTAAHPMSEGCLIIAPSDWTRFISQFLKAYPKLTDWTCNGGRVGIRIGSLVVSSVVPK